MRKADVCAVVATYNRKDLVSKCIDHILLQRDAECDIYVIDNGSTDGTEELFKEKYCLESIKYFNTGDNLGSAGAQAKGLKEAVNAGYKYIWLMDDDLFPHVDTLYELLKADKELNGEWGILSSVAYWIDGSICEANRQKKSIFKLMSEKDYSKQYVRVFMVSAASMFIKAEAIKEMGLPIADYFIYTDDYEFSSRIGRKYPVYVVTSSKVTHAMKNNMKCNIVRDTPDRLFRYKYLYRNDVHCYRHFGIGGYIYLFVKFAYTMIMIALKEKNDRKKKMEILISGYKAGTAFNPTIEKPVM